MAVPVSAGDVSKQVEDEDEDAQDSRGPDIPLRTFQDDRQSYLPLKFIDEGERRNDVAQFKRSVRSHVRRGSHARQRRLNEAARPRPIRSGIRKLIQKSGQREVENLRLAEQRAAPEVYTNQEISVHQPGYQISPVSAVFAVPTGFMTQNLIHNPAAASLPRITGAEAVGLPFSGVVSQQTSSAYFLPLPRIQFNTTTPYALLLGDGAPILLMQGRNWPFLHPIRGNGPALSVWMPAAAIPIPNARSPRPCLLQSARPISWITESLDYFSFKEVVIGWVNKNLSNTRAATSDVTIGVILCLMSWEISRGNAQELALHMNGLLRIINLRGGLQNLASIRQFCWKLQLIDLVVALQTSRQPLLPAIQLPAPSPPPQLNMSIGYFQIPDSPLWGPSPFQEILTISPFDLPSRYILQQMRLLTDGQDQPHEIFPIPEPVALSSSLSRIIYFTSTIYTKAFLNVPTPFNSVHNNAATKELCTGVEDTTNDETWTRYPGILLWIVLTGLAAAANLPERSYFAMFVFRVGTSAIWWGTEAASAAIRNFIAVKRRAEGVGR